MRDMAEERGMSILELSRLAQEDDQIDRAIDARSARLADEGGDFVMDARLGWYFVPDSIKIFLDVDPEVAAHRIFSARRGAEHENVDLAATEAAIRRRTASESQRYKEYYGIDYTDHRQYDLVIDTSHMTADEVVAAILDHVA